MPDTDFTPALEEFHAKRGAQSSLEEINQRLDTITHLLFRLLETMQKPPEHLWPRQ